jgi:hypothetical protein
MYVLDKANSTECCSNVSDSIYSYCSAYSESDESIY